ncbi:unnamed protein product [Auanema sp. JU1783]|nr:unnamed protein product [Auanema sp. JU1783]
MPLRGELPQGMDLNHLMMAIDPGLHISQMAAMSNGSPSPSSLPSSGSASTTGPTNSENQNNDESANSPIHDSTALSNLFNILPQFNQNNIAVPNLLEQMQQGNLFNMLNSNSILSQLNASPNKNKQQKKVLEEHSPLKVASSPQNGLSFAGFPFSLAPSTSTASSQPSVIVNSNSVTSSDRDDLTPPAQKRMKTEDDENAAAAKILANMGLQAASFPAALNFLMPSLPTQFNIGDFDTAAALAQLNNTTPTVKRQYSSNGKNYCDLCNKEVCNKYFLRTHMLKMHGIVIDENKTVIANIDTVEKERMGTLSFRCDICHTELKSRSLLRAHKQDLHGVMPLANSASRKSLPATPTTNGTTASNTATPSVADETKCPMCQRRIPSSQLAEHFQNDHAGDLPSLISNSSAASDLITPFSAAPSSPSQECKFCPTTFKDDIEAQMHIIQNHPTEFMHQQMQKELGERTESVGSSTDGVLHCKLCQYTTKDQRNLEMHLERHDRINEAKQQPDEDEDEALKMTARVALGMAATNKMLHLQMEAERYKCSLCDVVYDDEASLEAHATVAHNGLSMVKKETDEKTHERNSHTSGSISPSNESLPEGFGKAVNADKQYLFQSFMIKCNDPEGNFLTEIMAHLPVKSLIKEPTELTFQLVPQPSSNVF